MMALNLSISDVVDCYCKMVFYIAQFKINEFVFEAPFCAARWPC